MGNKKKKKKKNRQKTTSRRLSGIEHQSKGQIETRIMALTTFFQFRTHNKDGLAQDWIIVPGEFSGKIARGDLASQISWSSN